MISSVKRIHIVCILAIIFIVLGMAFCVYQSNSNVDLQNNINTPIANTAKVSADGYLHGSNIGRATSGSAVSNESQLRSALNSSGTYYLTQNITLSASNSFDRSNTFSGTLYGNGHTITVTGLLSSSSSITKDIANNTNIGGLVSKLTGRIYDLNVELKSGTSVAFLTASGSTAVRLGLIAGVIDQGGAVENCTVTIPSGSKLGALSYNATSITSGANVGAVAGQCNGSMTIKNVTVTNNGHILGALGSSTTSSSSYKLSCGTASMFVAFIWNDQTSYTQVMDNVVAKGNGKIEGHVTSVLGMTYTSTLPITINNYYSQFTGTYNYSNDGGWPTSRPYVSYTLLKWVGSSDASKVVNYYHSSNTNQAMMASGYYAVPQNSITVSATDYTVGFDPKATNTSNSLVISKSNITGGEDYTATIQGAGGSTIASYDYGFSADGRTVVFRNLPTAISNWGGNNGTFSCTITVKEIVIEVDPLAPVGKYEHSYTTQTSTTGTAVSNGTELANAISQNQDIYLTKDITDFKGFNNYTYSGTINGNGHTIYIVGKSSTTASNVGGIVGTLNGTIKNVRVVLYKSYVKTTASGSERPNIGLIAGSIGNNGTVNNVYAQILEGVELGFYKSGTQAHVGVIAGVTSGGTSNITNTTVHLDGTLSASGSYMFMSAFVGKADGDATGTVLNFKNIIFKGNGELASEESNSTEPAFMGLTTILSGSQTADYNLDGFINAFTGRISASRYSMYGVLTKNYASGGTGGWNFNDISNIYVYGDNVLADQNADYSTGGAHAGNGNNAYIDLANKKSTLAKTIDGESIAITPYFVDGNDAKLYIVADSPDSSGPTLVYNDVKSQYDSEAQKEVLSIDKTSIVAPTEIIISTVKIVSEPTLNVSDEDLVYTGSEIEVGINQLMSNNAVLDTSNYTVTIQLGEENPGSLSQNKPLNAGNYVLVVDLLNGYVFEDLSTQKRIEFTIKTKEIVINASDYTTSYREQGYTIDEIKSAIFGEVENIIVSVEPEGEVKNAGTYTITATPENSNYVLNGTASAVFTIEKVKLQVPQVDGTYTYNGTMQSVRLDSEEGIEFRSGDYQAQNAGDYSFVIGIKDTQNYEWNREEGKTDDIELSWSIAKAELQIATQNIQVVYDSENLSQSDLESIKQSLEGIVNDEAITLEYTVKADDMIVEEYRNAGVYTIEITLANNNDVNKNYILSGNNTATITITPVVLSGTFAFDGSDDGVYSGEQKSVIFSLQGNSVYEADGEVLTYSTSGDTTNAGNFDAIATINNSNYVFDGNQSTYTQQMTISPYVVDGSITLPQSLVYDGQEKVATFDFAEGSGLKNDDKLIFNYSTDLGVVTSFIPVDAGTYIARMELPAYAQGKYNYVFAEGVETQVEFTITQRTINVSLAEVEFTKSYDGVVFDNFASLFAVAEYSAETNTGILPDEEVVLTYSAGEEVKNAKTYTISITLDEETYPNYILSGTTSAEYTIEQATIGGSIQLPENLNYDNQAKTATFQISVGSLYGDDAIVLEYKTKTGETYEDEGSTEAPVNAGTYLVSAMLPDSNYKWDNGEGYTAEMIINKAPNKINGALTIDSWTYGDEANAPSVVTADFGEVVYEYATSQEGEYSLAVPTNAGTYYVRVRVEGTANYDAVTSEAVQFVIAKATASIQAQENVTTEYTGKIFDDYASLFAVTGVNEEVVELTYELNGGMAIKNAGVYTITARTKNDNYEEATASITYTVNAKNVTLTIEGATKVYDGEEYDLSGYEVQGTEGFIASDNVVVTVSATNASANAGTYDLVITTTADDNKNYNITRTDGAKLVIEKATIETPEIASKTYTGETLTADITSTDEYTVTTNNGGVEVGNYDVVLTATANYKWADGEESIKTLRFEITKASVVLGGELSIAGWTYGDEANVPSGVTTNFGEVVYEYATSQEGEYNTQAPVNAGTYYVRATVAGTTNYNGATGSAVQFVIAKVVVQVPEIASKTYTGSTLTADIASTDEYTVASNEGGVNVGNYDVVLNVNANYKWADSDESTKTLSFAITKANNSLNGELSIEDWTYGDDANVPSGVTTNFGEVVYEYATSEDGAYSTQVPVNAGTYYVRAKVEGTANYEGSTSNAVQFTIAKLVIAKPQPKTQKFTYTGSELTYAIDANDYYTISGNKATNAGDYVAVVALTDKINIEWADKSVEDLSFEWSIAKATREINASLKIGYKTLSIIIEGDKEGAVYSIDGITFKPLVDTISVDIQSSYTIYVKFNETANYYASPEKKILAVISKSILKDYIDENFGETFGWEDIAKYDELSELVQVATGEDAEFDTAYAELTAKKTALIDSAKEDVQEALSAGSKLAGYQVAVAVAMTLTALGAGMAMATMAFRKKGGKRND